MVTTYYGQTTTTTKPRPKMFWRVKVKVKDVNDYTAHLIIPSWNPTKIYYISWEKLPEFMKGYLKPGMVLYAKADSTSRVGYGSYSVEFRDWEIEITGEAPDETGKKPGV